MKNSILILLFGIAHFSVNANDKIVDSLNDVSYDLGNSFPDSSFNIGRKSFERARAINYVNGEITALCRMGRAVYKTGDFDSSLYYYDKAEQRFYEDGSDSIFLAKTFIYQGLIYRKLGQLDFSLNKYQYGYEIAKALKDEVIMGQCLINISNLLKSRGDYKASLTYLHDALSHFSDTNYDDLGMIYLNIGNIYDIQGRGNEALISFRIASQNFQKTNNYFSLAKSMMNIGNIFLSQKSDSALFYYNKTLSISNFNESDEIKGQTYHNMGEFYFNEGEPDISFLFYQKSLEIKREINNWQGQSITFERLGDIYSLKKSTDSALTNYLFSYSFAKEMSDHQQLKDISYKLSNTYSLLNDQDSALFYLQISNAYQDSISESMNAALIYEINYNNEKHKVEQLEIENEIQASDIKKQETISKLAIGIGVLSIAFLLYVVKFSRQKQQNAKAQKEIDDLIHSQEKNAINAMLDGQENERNRIAGELHDKLGGMLSMVKLYFKSMDKQIDNLKSENVKQFEKANLLLDEACDETRKIAHELSTGILSRMGLFKAVKSLISKIEDSGEIKVSLSSHGTDDELKTLNEIAIYRIIQELVSNILKHANASEITIQLNVFEELFNVVIEDNGVGFDVNQIITNNGMGLRGIEARTQNMNGTFSIDSVNGKGTTISIDIPLK